VDPLGRLEPFEHPDVRDAVAAAGEEAAQPWRAVYSGTIGFEFMHLVERDRLEWMRARIEAGPPEVDTRWILGRLLETELFERFLHARYVGSKRFSIDGVAGLVPLLDAMLDAGAKGGAEFLYLAMSHRGRLNVMRNVVQTPSSHIFAGMEDIDPRSVLGAGDVKYHMGATGRYRTRSGAEVEVHLATNPSHLEAVDPVIMGRTKARQFRWGSDGETKMLSILCHGDAAFAGQGITSETLNLAGVPGYSVGGTIHVVVNNLIGFTAEPRALHSTRFASDAARRLSIPVIRVNGEDLDAVWWAGVLAADYRHAFKSDVVVDIIGFRRYGHSEVEDPTLTQPLLYAKIKQHPMLWEIYAERIGAEPAVVEGLREKVEEELARGQEAGRAGTARPTFWQLPGFWGRYHGDLYDERVEMPTAVDAERIAAIAERITRAPDGFSVHPKARKLLQQRRDMAAGARRVDWGMAEALAFGSLLWDGVHVRLSGQDSRRGTFNHRHAVLVDTQTGAEHLPLAHLHKDQGPFTALDSTLSEAGVLGFEYGYSREYPDGLVLWEAQFGDFANGAQVIIDQFLTAGEDKWNLLSGLVMLLPHGYEGQGPEHSSARIERFLQLGAQDNIQVCQPSTSGQYFHALRRQVLLNWRKPLVLFMPKSILRAEPACSPVEELSKGAFQPIIPDDEVSDATAIILCTGKIVHELRAERTRRGAMDRAIITVERLYPFPALSYIRPRLQRLVGDRHVTSVKRYESASPATGSAKAHVLEQQALLKLAFA
jgi:2-oxoglutarate dehydrogenase E1 component